MPIIRVDIPEGHSRETKLRLRREIHDLIAATWAREHIYISIREVFTEPGLEQGVVTVDVRPGRGREQERTDRLYRGIARSFRALPEPRPKDFVLLVRQFPAEGFATEAGPLPDLKTVTPPLEG